MQSLPLPTLPPDRACPDFPSPRISLSSLPRSLSRYDARVEVRAVGAEPAVAARGAAS